MMTGCVKFNARNHLEEQLCSQIAHNFVQRRAIEQFASRQQGQAAVDRFRERIGKGIPRLQDDQGRLPYYWHRFSLVTLKELIVEGEFPAAKECLDLLSESKSSAVAETLKFAIELASMGDDNESVKQLNSKAQDWVDLIDLEIECLEQAEREESAIENKFAALPPDDVMEKLSRYRSSNSRELSRLVANFEALRKLSNLK